MPMPRIYRSRYVFAEPDLGLEVRTDVPMQGERFQTHAHDFYELVLVTAGSGIHVTTSERYPIAAGDVFITPRGRAHGYQSAAGMQRQIVMFDPSRLNLPHQTLGRIPGYHALFLLEPQYRRRHRFQSRLHLDTADLDRAVGRVRRLGAELAGRQAGYEAAAVAQFIDLAVFLSRCYRQDAHPCAASLLRLGKVLSYLEQRCEPVALRDLARRAEMSISHLVRTFKAATGHTPIDHHLRIRILRAAARLRQGDEPVMRIAMEAGFHDSNYFTRQFRRIMGCSPRAYRKGAG